MITLHPNESILLVLRKHWFLMVPAIGMFLFLSLLPLGLFIFLPRLIPLLDASLATPLIGLIVSAYCLVVWLLLFFMWMDYYLDMWIVTNERIIDVEQEGLFSRHAAEIPLQRVQDVTIEVRGIFATFLGFGTIKIQTAGEREFFIEGIPRLDEVKMVILRFAKNPPGEPYEGIRIDEKKSLGQK